MRTLDFKVWLIGLMFATASPVVSGNTVTQPMVAINVNRNSNYTAFMNKDREIYYLPETNWTDGDVAEIVMEDGMIVSATYESALWRYDNAGAFTNIGYPWWYTGRKPETVKTEVVR